MNQITIIGESNKVYDAEWEASRYFVKTGNRRAFIMRKEYEVKDGGNTWKIVCDSTFQKEGKSAFGGFGFNVVL